MAQTKQGVFVFLTRAVGGVAAAARREAIDHRILLRIRVSPAERADIRRAGFVLDHRVRAVDAAGPPAQNAFFQPFPHLCPEPVLVK